MPVFRFTAEVTVSAVTEVEADTAEEAREIAKERLVTIRRGHGDNGEAREQWVIDDADGDPQNITLSE